MPRITVALETSSRPASVAAAAAAEGGEPCVSVLDDDRAHASDLLPHLSELVSALGGVPADIERVIVGTGPGSYTGLRVGSATALGLSAGLSAGSSAGPNPGPTLGTGPEQEAGSSQPPPFELIGIPSFEALAYAELDAGERAAVVRNAFGGHLYLASYGRTPSGLIEFQAPSCVTVEEAKVILHAESLWLADEGALRVIRSVQGADLEASRTVREAQPGAGALLALAAHSPPGSPSSRYGPEAIQPLYLRPFEAKVRKR